MNVNKKNKNGETALIRASQKGDKEICKYILNKSSVEVKMDEKNTDGNTALHMVSFNGYIEICKLLIGRKIEKNIRNR